MSRSDFKLDSIFPKSPIKTKMNKMSPEKGFFNTFLANQEHMVDCCWWVYFLVVYTGRYWRGRKNLIFKNLPPEDEIIKELWPWVFLTLMTQYSEYLNNFSKFLLKHWKTNSNFYIFFNYNNGITFIFFLQNQITVFWQSF